MYSAQFVPFATNALDNVVHGFVPSITNNMQQDYTARKSANTSI